MNFMDVRKISSTILLLFIVVSLAVLAVQRYGADDKRATGSRAAPAPASASPDVDRKLIVYYFHGTSRSTACKNVEALAHEAIQSGFAGQLQSGRVKWRVVDYDRPENRHFQIDYDLDAPALVMVRMRGDRQWGWDRLDEAKDLAGDKPRFFDLLQRQIRESLGGG